MPKKTFKIGEESYYGKWQLEVKDEIVIVKGIDWDTGKVCREDVFSMREVNNFDLEHHLIEMSTFYHGQKMMDWVKEHIKVQERSFTTW